MKEWWINLNIREKQALLIGGTIVLFFLLYEITLSPLSNYNASLRDEIHHNQKLLSWMEEADQHIQATEKMLHKNNSKNSAALLSLAQKEIAQSPFANNLGQLGQSENNSVQITLQKVKFDELMKWLTLNWQKNGLTVTQITAAPNGSPGVIDTTIVITN